MTRRVGYGDAPPEDPRRRVRQAAIRMALAEAPAALLLAFALAALHTGLGPALGLPETGGARRMVWTVVAAGAYVIYSAVLTVVILLPALREARDAR